MAKYEILDRINCPSDIKNLSVEELEILCSDIRSYMVECCSVNPGHLASSLGAVELIVALHKIYNTPEDKLVFDVGHQAYAHKIITGRKEAFKTNRTKDGISGFPKMDESPYDAFGVGHSSTSISAALGLAEASKLRGEARKVVALIGDGALTGGLALEGLNNAGDSKADLLVILNDNNQSIDKNLGALHEHLLSITTAPVYNRLKDKVWRGLGEGKARLRVQNWVQNLKSLSVRKSGGDLFEALGFRYFGPIDGNNIKEVKEALERLKDIKGPRLLHCLTVKGKGYAPAEEDPTIWHAPGKFNPETGERVVPDYKASRYQDVFGEVLCELAARDERVVGITPAMASGCGMTKFAEMYPNRFFDVGIEEEHAVTFSAGLAAGGLKPFCNIYSAFSQRAYDQIIHDVALQNLPVVLCFDRAGLVGEDGPTHHGAYDMAAYRSIPNCTIVAPSNEIELKNAMFSSLSAEGGPYIIRYPRGLGEGVDWANAPYRAISQPTGSLLKSGAGVAVLALGPVVNRALEASRSLEAQGKNHPAVYDMRFLKPIDENILEEVAKNYSVIITLEDGCLKGGLYSEVCEYMAAHKHNIKIDGYGIPDKFIAQGRQSEEREECGLSAKKIEKVLEDWNNSLSLQSFLEKGI